MFTVAACHVTTNNKHQGTLNMQMRYIVINLLP